jgi:hypothetical protein
VSAPSRSSTKHGQRTGPGRASCRRLACALEDCGATFPDGDDLVVDGPRDFLTEDDRAAIRRWRRHLKVIASYRAPEVIE